MRRPPLAAVQVDCDGELALAHHYGTAPTQNDGLYEALPVLLGLFRRWGLTATLFVVGKDLEDERRRLLLAEAVAEGHEIANHTYSHPRSFSSLSVREREEEITRCDQVITRCLGVKAVGFRAPNFELATGVSTVLTRLGYVYDSSLLPTPYGAVLRRVKRLVAGPGAEISGYGAGSQAWCSPRRPFNQTGVVTVPVSVSLTRLPVHAGFMLALPDRIGRAAAAWEFWWARRLGWPLVYVFHLGDVADGSCLSGAEKRLFANVDRRLEFVSWLCRSLSRFCSVTTRQLAQLYGREVTRWGCE